MTVNSEDFKNLKNLYNESQYDTIYDAIDLFNKLYDSMDYVIYSHELFNSECPRYDEYMTSRRGLEPVITNLIQEFKLNSDDYPAFHSYIKEGAPCDDDIYNDPDIDLDAMSDEDKEQYQASKEEMLGNILEAIKNEFDKFFIGLKVTNTIKSEETIIKTSQKQKKGRAR